MDPLLGRLAGGAAALAVAAALVASYAAPPPSSTTAPAVADEAMVADDVTAADDGAYVAPVNGALLVPFDDPDAPWGAGHRGVDLAAAVGAPVVAAADGVVAFAGTVVDRPVLSVDHPDGIRTTYEPVVAVVAAGDRVARGEVIGHLAPAGWHCAPASCLHWGARVGDDYLDPMSLLREVVIRLYPDEAAGPGSPARVTRARHRCPRSVPGSPHEHERSSGAGRPRRSAGVPLGPPRAPPARGDDRCGVPVGAGPGVDASRAW